LTETPIFHVYSRQGNTVEETPICNKNFENRLSLIAETFLLKSTLKFKLPLTLQHIHYSNYDLSAQLNNGWGRALWIYPEITYPVTDSITVGVAYAKDLLSDLSQANETMDAASNNIFQVIFQTTL
jgi:hypothetical protein